MPWFRNAASQAQRVHNPRQVMRLLTSAVGFDRDREVFALMRQERCFKNDVLRVLSKCACVVEVIFLHHTVRQGLTSDVECSVISCNITSLLVSCLPFRIWCDGSENCRLETLRTYSAD